MLDKLFPVGRAFSRHKNAPDRQERESFLERLAQQGYTKGTLRRTAYELLWLVSKIPASLKVTTQQVEGLTRRWARRQYYQGQTHSPQWAQNSFKCTAIRWLESRGRWQPPSPILHAFHNLVEMFADWMKHERGLSPVTIRVRCRYTDVFLRWYESLHRPLQEIRISDIDDYQMSKWAERWCRQSAVNNANALKAFFRYAGIRGWCSPKIAEAIQKPRLYSYEDVPRGPSWDQVKSLLSSLKTDRPQDIRNLAMLLLFAVYGFRGSEVAALRLEDIDWEGNRITVWRTKSRKSQTYPLVQTVGQAVIRYLREVRPKEVSRREIFLRMRAPFQTLTDGGLATMVRRRLDAMGIKLVHRGPHALRHACATHLLAEGFSMKEIGDHLGHRSLDATRIYAKVDMVGLRAVGSFDGGGLL